MKKILLSLALAGAAFIGHSQEVLDIENDGTQGRYFYYTTDFGMTKDTLIYVHKDSTRFKEQQVWFDVLKPAAAVATNPSYIVATLNGKLAAVRTDSLDIPWNGLIGKPSTFAPSAHTHSWADITSGKPTTLSGYGITDAYPLSGNPSGFRTQSQVRSDISLTTTGTSGAATYNSSTGVLNIPNYATASTPAINDVTRPINSTTWTISTTKQATVYYNVRITCSATIGSAASGTLSLQYSTNGGSNWITAQDFVNSNTVTLAVTLNSTTIATGTIAAVIPANALVRIVQTTSGSTTCAWVRGQEVY